jgi:REP element-mobilizing transposase RayT
MVRALDGRPLFRDDRDRADLVGRLAAVAARTRLAVLAWALLPNHIHLLVRTPPASPEGTYRATLAPTMRRLLTGYAGAFNRRHGRKGHLVQNRYKSILVEEEPYLLELVRYIHLNPLRANVVSDLRALDRYPWSGHSALVGAVPRPWQSVAEVLGLFGGTPRARRQRYQRFVAGGIGQGQRPELQGGGLRRSAGGWEGVTRLRRGREAWAADERVLGSGPFVERILRETPPRTPPVATTSALPALIAAGAAAMKVSTREIMAGSRRRPVAHARAVVSWVALQQLGLPATAVARALGVTPAVVRRTLEQGSELLAAHGVPAEILLAAIEK